MPKWLLYRLEVEFYQSADSVLAYRTEDRGTIGVHTAVRVAAIDSFGLVASAFIDPYE